MRKILLSLVALFICAINVKAEEVVFEFTDPSVYGFGVPAAGAFTQINSGDKITSGVITISPDFSSGNGMRFFANTNTGVVNLRAYVNSTINFTIDGTASITNIKFEGSNLGSTYLTGEGYADGEWSGEAKTVTLNCIKSTVQFNKITVTYGQATGVSAPEFSLKGGNIYEVSSLTLTAAAGDIYYAFDEGEYSKYTSPITIDKSVTVSAYAQVGETKSSVKSNSYVMAKEYESLDELLRETPTKTGWPVAVPVQGEEIKDFYWSTAGENKYKNGVYLVRQANGKDFELYKQGVPEEWQIGDKLTGLAKGVYQDYNGQWEISLVSWDGFTNGTAVVQAPVITFDEATKTVTITDPSGENNTIFYTLDGSDPDDSSILYEGPFTIEQTTNVKAVCYNDDDAKSGVTAYKCTIEAGLENIAGLLAECTATSQNDAPEVTFNMSDVLVTGVAGSNVFISDATGTFLLYGSGSGLKKGDKIAGSVKGKLYSYNGLPELSVSDKWANVNKVSEDNEVALTIMKAADVTAADASKYVAFENVKFVTQEEGSKHITYTFKQDGFEFNLFDNFDVLKNMTFNSGDAYTYILRVYAIPYKEIIQYYAVSADDITEFSSKEKAICQFDDFADNQLFNMKNQSYVAYNSTVASDAPSFVFETSDADVATIEFGQINLVGPGVATVSFSTPETEFYTAAKDSRTVRVWSGAAGEFNDAYCVGDVKALFADGDTLKNVWVKAYIVGTAKSNMNNVIFGNGDGTQSTNLVIAAKADESNAAKCLPVELPKGKMREALNLVDNPDNLGKQVWLNGNIIKYMSVAGLKGVADYSFDGKTPSSIENIKIDDAQSIGVYNLAGQKVDASFKGIVIINGKKYLNK